MPRTLIRSRWMKANRYELVDAVIRPVEGANLTSYDPWRKYAPRLATMPRKQAPPPYESLITLLRDIKLNRETRQFPPGVDNTEVETEVLEWCSKNGLLGILPHRMHLMFLAPRWQAGADVAAFPGQQSYVRFGGQWLSRARTGVRRGPTNARPNALVPPGRIPDGWPAPYAVMQTSVASPDVEPQTLNDAIRRFFLTVRTGHSERHEYPLPLTREFWRQYGEPLDEFLRGALTLWDAMDLMAGSAHQKRRGRIVVNTLTASVRPLLRETEDSETLQWTSPSLLASFAMMFTQDVAKAKRVRQCVACQVPFVAHAYQARYCSETCQNRMQKRRHRARLL